MKEKPDYIVIEGNIGAGKTTLAIELAKQMAAKLVLERAEDNPYLPLFYKDMDNYALPLEISLLIERYQQLSRELLNKDSEKQNFVFDYGYFKSLIFARNNLNPVDYKVFQKIYDVLYKSFPKPLLIVILVRPATVLQHHIKHRARTFEAAISRSYLENINRGYEEYIEKNLSQNILVIETSDDDFTNHKVTTLSLIEMIVNQKNKKGIRRIKC